MKSTLLFVAGAITMMGAVAMASEGTHWTYSGATGPEHWGDIAAEFEMCRKGLNQSPVDLTGMIEAEMQPISFNYKPVAPTVENNGHSIKAGFDNGSTITVGGHTYKLLQVHFHTPSENNINGQSFPMEAHFVHADEAGKLAVIGLMYQDGTVNSSLAPIWENMPAAAGAKVQPAGASLDAAAMLPANRDYYRFNGSLTTPPCSEGVLWLVMKAPVTVSAEQVGKFHALFQHDTNRPIQPLNARAVLQ